MLPKEPSLKPKKERRKKRKLENSKPPSKRKNARLRKLLPELNRSDVRLKKLKQRD